MNRKRMRKWNIAVFLLLAAATGGLAVPGVKYFRDLIFAGAETAEATAGAVLVYGLTAIVFLAAIGGILSVFRISALVPSAVIAIVLIGCGAAMVFGVQQAGSGSAEPVESTGETPSPRPTVTPPPVEIAPSGSVSDANPETGTEFYRLYASYDTTLVIDNGSTSDIFMQMLDRYDHIVLQFYIRFGETLEIAVPWGTYHFQLATGRYWEGTDTLFGDKTHYRALPETYSLQRQTTEYFTFSVGFPETETIKERAFIR